MRTQLMAIAALLAVGASAQAADNGFYLGGALSRSTLDTDNDFFGFSFEEDDTAWKAIAGFRPIDPFGIELNYVNFGEMSTSDFPSAGGDGNASYEATALDAFAVGYIGGPFIEVFGKFGVVRWDAEAILRGDVTLPEIRADDSGTDMAWGGGLQLSSGSLALRLEYEKFELAQDDEIDMWSLGATWTFF